MPNYTHGSCKVSSRRSFCSSVKNNFKKWLLHHFGGQPSWVKAVIPLLLFGVAVKTYVHTQGNVYVYKSVRSDFKATVSTFLYVSNNTASTIKIGVIEYASVARKWMVRTLALILNMQCVPQNTSTNLLIHRSSSVKKKKPQQVKHPHSEKETEIWKALSLAFNPMVSKKLLDCNAELRLEINYDSHYWWK